MFPDVGASPVRSDAALPIGSSSALVPALDFICFERDSDSAVAAVLIYRMISYYLPPIWGWFCMSWLQKRHYL